MEYVTYNDEGRILQWGSCPNDMLAIQASPGRNVIAGTGSDTTHYVRRGKVDTIELRPQNPTVLDGMKLVNVPENSVLQVNSTDYETSDTTVELAFSDIGHYTVTVKCWPYLDKTFEISI